MDPMTRKTVKVAILTTINPILFWVNPGPNVMSLSFTHLSKG